MKKKLYILLLLNLIVVTCFGQTTIPDSTAISGQWTVDNSPFLIEGRAIVPGGQTLTIDPGVTVKFKSSTSSMPSWFDYEAGNVGVLRVQGEIIANGTVNDPIIFTRNTTGFWGTILIDEGSGENSSISHCIIEYGKESRFVTGISAPISFNGGVSIFKSNINITENEIKNNNVNGIYLREVNNPIEIFQNAIHQNGANGLISEQSEVFIINNLFYGNSVTSSGSVSAIRSSNSTSHIAGNLFYDNDDFGIYTTDGGNNYIISNTVFNNTQGIRVESGANAFIYNTIVQNNSINFATGNPGGANIEMRHSLTDDSSFPQNIVNVGGNLLSADAMFANTADFSLQANSPCIDAGYPDTTGLHLPDADILGNPRIDNSIIDIGATEFQQPMVNYTITTAANPEEGGFTTGDGSYPDGSNVTVTASANDDYEFINWTENGTPVSSNEIYSFEITRDRDLVANFNYTLQSFTVTTTANPETGGYTTGDGTYDEGDIVTVSAVSNSDYSFVNWTEDAIVVSTDSSFTFTIASHRDLVANFDQTVGAAGQYEATCFNVYPNPTNGIIHVETDKFESAKILTPDGQLISVHSENTIDVRHLSSGVYILWLKSTDHKVTQEKIIKW